jgi:cytochrome c oxidase subunit IV
VINLKSFLIFKTISFLIEVFDLQGYSRFKTFCLTKGEVILLNKLATTLDECPTSILFPF